jgi:hypothetical protein
MKTPNIPFVIMIFTLSIFSLQTANAANLYQSEKTFSSYVDKINGQKALLVYQDSNEAQILNLGTQKLSGNIYQMSKECRDNNILNKFVYAHPFLTNSQTTCYIDEESGQLRFIGKTKAPKDNFSFVYLSMDKDNYYFLLNGRDFPNGSHGYIQVKAISRDARFQEIFELISHVPGLSGAMNKEADSDNIYYTEASGMNSNKLYTISAANLMSVIKERSIRQFSEVSTIILKPFRGLSFYLFSNGEELLYFNNSPYGEYPSYTVNKLTGKREKASLPKGCKPVGARGSKWLLQCQQKNLLTMPSL